MVVPVAGRSEGEETDELELDPKLVVLEFVCADALVAAIGSLA
jgi:hypothetical protein